MLFHVFRSSSYVNSSVADQPPCPGATRVEHHLIATNGTPYTLVSFTVEIPDFDALQQFIADVGDVIVGRPTKHPNSFGLPTLEIYDSDRE